MCWCFTEQAFKIGIKLHIFQQADLYEGTAGEQREEWVTETMWKCGKTGSIQNWKNFGECHHTSKDPLVHKQIGTSSLCYLCIKI